ncbi:glycoside hydrolase family 108 protein [Sulfurimonas sp.]|uniref:glycoside hydrolase family 108 protein n=1 Tax=Sulfurimonas sp. TaxID=2022749 RepID=UPI0025E30CF7|nr:N-acetylmuramidase [Sulfurimonas sp.]
MDLFDRAFENTIGHEGGYVDDSTDNGGETKFGISKRSYPELDIKNLSQSTAKSIYYKDYWDTKQANLSRLPDSIAIEVFDTGVNMGRARALKMLQEALNLLNRNESRFDDLEVDGWIGNATIKAIEKTKESELLKVLNGLQFVKYLTFVQNNQSQERFFAGWIKRT